MHGNKINTIIEIRERQLKQQFNIIFNLVKANIKNVDFEADTNVFLIYDTTFKVKIWYKHNEACDIKVVLSNRVDMLFKSNCQNDVDNFIEILSEIFA